MLTPTQTALGTAAEMIGLVPLVAVASAEWRRGRRDPVYWWLAAAFVVSFVADVLAHYWTGHPVVARVYPIAQCVLVLATILARQEAVLVLVIATVVAALGLLGNPLPNDDVVLRIVAFGAVAGIAWQLPALGWLRTTLLVYFGLGLVAWIGYVVHPGWLTWALYQGTRAAGVACFCIAVAYPRPTIRLASRRSA